MDFDLAATRLKKDQQSALARSRNSRNARTASSKAKREAQIARRNAEQRLKEKKLQSERSSRIVDAIVMGVGRVERNLGVTNVHVATSSMRAEDANKQSTSRLSTSPLFANSPNPLASGWSFTSTSSIHGDGDKIALPPSVLETMTSGNNNDLDPWGGGRNGRPVAFRIGIVNPEYAGFPCSDKMKALVETVKREIIESEKKNGNDMVHQSSSSMGAEDITNSNSKEDDIDESDDETDDNQILEAYLDELSHRYLSYTHGTVVEFTQEEGCVGLPEPIARALLQPNTYSLVGNNATDAKRKCSIPKRRTVDPASAAAAKDVCDKEAEDDAMNVDTPNNKTKAMEEDADVGGEKTPGHPAYGLFDIPALPIEITPINALPPGTNCTFTPTSSSIENGFYGLKDIKLVLEQSLMRTRATLSKGDVIRTWRRGVSFDLIVSSLSPETFGTVSCINTNINVDIGPPEGGGEVEDESAKDGKAGAKPGQHSMGAGGGRTLSEPLQQQPASSTETSAPITAIELPPEPDESKKEGVCNIQIRGRTPSGNSAAGRRRFDITTATIANLFAFASNICEGSHPSSFRLVTRFPRRVFQLASSTVEGGYADNATLESVGLTQGQEMFMVESV